MAVPFDFFAFRISIKVGFTGDGCEIRSDFFSRDLRMDNFVGQNIAGDADRRGLFGTLLRDVSRAFYLTLRILPKKLREPIGLAYLLARAADTIADTRFLPAHTRLAHLLTFRAQLRGPIAAEPLQALAQAAAEGQATPAEQRLLASLPKMFALLEALPHDDRRRIRSVVETLTQGMKNDLAFFPQAEFGSVKALPDTEALDAYTYYVAGCVGEFWTEMLVAYESAVSHWDAKRLSAAGVRFGKALQLVNVLRDIPRDLRLGRCYLPQNQLTAENLLPDDLLEPKNAVRAGPLLRYWINQALEHFQAAEEYLFAHPQRCLRLRLAVLWPILIGLATLARLAREDNWLDPGCTTKVSRGWVYRMMLLSVPCAASNVLLRRWIKRLRASVDKSLASR
jgi:farnesyl-diphosphate farnesyltransferase